MPYTQERIPFQGNTPQSKHASWTGAKAAARTKRGKTARYLELLREHGPISDQAMAALTGWALSSCNSIRHGVRDQVVADGFETAGAAKRTKWRLR